jgi:hypothetical protein
MGKKLPSCTILNRKSMPKILPPGFIVKVNEKDGYRKDPSWTG